VPAFAVLDPPFYRKRALTASNYSSGEIDSSPSVRSSHRVAVASSRYRSVNRITCPESQLSIGFVERDRAFEVASRVENTNFAAAKARAALSVINCLTLIREHRLNAGCLENLPTPTVRPYFNDCRRTCQADWLHRLVRPDSNLPPSLNLFYRANCARAPTSLPIALRQ
jgi:hypothetical protein